MNKETAALLLLFSAGLYFTPSVVGAASRESRPNVVLFYADDLGWGDLSIHDGTTPTPNIDRLFTQGVRFDNYSTHCVCSPSRAGLLTGRHYIRLAAGPRTGGELPLAETTIAESFRAAGYATGAFGKWHNGAPTSYGDCPIEEGKKKYPLGPGVNAHGFDRFVGYYGGGGSYFDRYANVYLHQAWYHDQTNVPEEQGYTTDLITKHALAFINRHQHEPFFCYIPHEAAHNPLHATYEDILRVPEAVRQGTPLLSQEEYDAYFRVRDAWKRLPNDQIPIVRSAMLLSLDDGIGRVMEFLEQADLLENTIVLFASDNGATPDGNNLPLRGGKHTVYEGGIRVPAALWWKGSELEGGKTYSGDFGYLDVYPTLCALAGIERQPGPPLDGRDLSASIRSGKTNPPVPHHFVWMREGVTRDGRWKLIYNLEEMQLFDMENDVVESTNLAEDMPELVATLKAKHEQWLEEIHCNPSYAVPRVDKDARAAPEGDVLEFYAEQTARVPGIRQGLRFIFALGYGEEHSAPPLPGDIIEYDICVADDGRLDGFFYTPSHGWNPHFLSNTGYDQFGRLQPTGPAPRGGRGVWEHRAVGVGEACPNRMPFNIISLSGRDPGTYHFYLDNLVVRRANGQTITMWKDDSHTFTRWHEEPFMMTPNHPAFTDLRVQSVPLNSIRP